MNILVTGAKGNLGIAVVKTFLNKNSKVFACISPRDQSLEIKDENLSVFPLDLNDAEACITLTNNIIEKHFKVDAAVLTVGGFAIGSIENVSVADFEKMIALNFYTAFNMAQPLLKQMKQQEKGGKIILIGSEPGRDIGKAKGTVAYAFSKSLIFRLAELINAEGKDKNIFSHVIIPTTIDTPQNRAAMPNADFSKWQTPESIANEIADLCN